MSDGKSKIMQEIVEISNLLTENSMEDIKDIQIKNVKRKYLTNFFTILYNG